MQVSLRKKKSPMAKWREQTDLEEYSFRTISELLLTFFAPW